ncbi:MULTISPECIES: flippase activity-associated protein Agl23 [unclassified Haladaptatus]|uniref:flippase activity-associated protein Agl23 n=1 Tax=unclassified Haladaptatus TaxID=2622732 RepID=UPI00209BE38F|nr:MULTISPECIES: flippase activity-associated protein Agl23 [unclassified Haladaptatus]MCO8243222.1 TIGR03663 family protein [Haladaptatus sp. AB643]MCO8252934.1 TIGR03663 family protein [Haladaptatus sp. AB618]
MQGSDTAQKRTRPLTSSDESSLLQRLTEPVPLVVLITVVGLALRLVSLGARVAHQDEARVAYWIYTYSQNGVWYYRHIIHGPFLMQVNSIVFSLFGANDFTMRFVVALLGGLLPLAALLFRERLRPSETVALAFLFAANPVLLYYSRFMRNDVILGVAMVFALGFLVRYFDTHRLSYFFAAVACFALGFTMKENALLYVACWVGAGVLLYDHRLMLKRVGNEGIGAAVPRRYRIGAVRLMEGDRSVMNSVLKALGVGLAAVIEFLIIFIYFYAPRSQSQPGPGLWKSLSHPEMIPKVLVAATVTVGNNFIGWQGHADHAYLPYLEHLLTTLKVGALALCILAVVGFVLDRYSGDRPRDVVAFGFYWGVASILGYPLVMDIKAGWAAVHAIIPLAFPAAVGLALVFRWGWEAYEDHDDVSLAAAAVLLLLVVASAGTTAYSTTYQHPQDPDNQFVQYAQSSSTHSKPLLHTLERISRENEGTDVLFYGSKFYSSNEAADDVYPVESGEGGEGWFARLPLNWYLESADAQMASTQNASNLRGDKPPIVIAPANVSTCSSEDSTAEDIEGYMSGYTRYEFQRFSYNSGCHISTTVIYVQNSSLSS